MSSRQGGKSSLPKLAFGIKLNNPGNIRYVPNNEWLGEIGSEDGFVKFLRPLYGIRAIFKILQTYSKRGIKSVQDIVSTYAPNEENPTESYIESVVQRTGFDRTFIPESKYEKIALVRSIVYFEIGRDPYSESLYANAYDLAQAQQVTTR